MLKRLGILLLAAVLAGGGAGHLRAQDGGETSCAAIVETAYTTTRETCAETGRDEACYGHAAIQIAPDTLTFSEPGDVVKVAEIENLRLGTMDVEAAEWGIALLRVQAGLPDEIPENVEIVLFGDVEITAAEDAGPAYGPMQAFTFRSGVDDAPCAQAPSSGLLIQTSAGVGEITLLVNEVVIQLGSTAYLQATPGEQMTVRVVEGQAKVTADRETVTVPAGAETSIPLDETGIASGAPESPAPYDPAVVEALPVDLLAVPVEVAPPLAATGAEAGGLCTVVAARAINRRGGPGTDFPVMGQLAPGQAANPDGQAVGVDGYNWWRLDDGSWVRSDVVQAGDACADLPTVEAPLPPPPVATVPPVPGGEAVSVTVSVPGISASWTGTGIFLRAGQRFAVSASGLVQYGPDASLWTIGPNGNPELGGAAWPVPGVRDIALAGRIGDGPGFFVGVGGTFTAQSDGELQLIVNDNIFDDNSGEFVVTIQVLP